MATMIDPEATYAEFMEMDGNDVTMVVQRTLGAQLRDGLDATISQEAMRDLRDRIGIYLGTRIMRFSHATGVMPQEITVTIDVRMTP